ncbi:uncharacterized protein LOC128547956 [Mercenaria mercenaria]|uniref:uncharacterized protein LOC128547956 n=1 Tax=Mercenaria mercenaria TaxID=6596 RepID=UPI00234FA3D3|nr:uncharacterized protein LOC128547956 [Mercenaria mercenaria]XP_053377919.1 uncharacterized protein LOC128547956 [Mercenaria mercenaria]
MTKAPKKAFPNWIHVIDTSIMKLPEDFEDLNLPREKEFEKIIKSAHPKASNKDDKSEIKVRCFETEHSVNGDVGSQTNLNIYHINEHDLTASNNTEESAYSITLKLLKAHRTFAGYRSACQNFGSIERQTAELFRYLSKWQKPRDSIRKEGTGSPVGSKMNVSRTNDSVMLEKEIGNTDLFAETSASLDGNSAEEGAHRKTVTKTENTEVLDYGIGCFKKNENGVNINDYMMTHDDSKYPKTIGYCGSNGGFTVRENTLAQDMYSLLNPF